MVNFPVYWRMPAKWFRCLPLIQIIIIRLLLYIYNPRWINVDRTKRVSKHITRVSTQSQKFNSLKKKQMKIDVSKMKGKDIINLPASEIGKLPTAQQKMIKVAEMLGVPGIAEM